MAIGALASLSTAAQTLDSTSTVSGCIADATGQPLPGVTVDVGRSGNHRSVLSNSAGCYVVTGVPSGSYFVFARLQGFISVTRDNLHVEPGRSEAVNFEMRVAPICECVGFDATLVNLWNKADTVVRVRITGHDLSGPQVRHSASVLKVWKRSPTLEATDALTFLQPTERDEIEPYAVGQEFVIFLKWSSTQRMFVRLSSGDGIVAAFAIEDGRIHSAPTASYVGMDEQQLVKELASLVTR